MKKSMKTLLSLMLAMVLVLGTVSAAFAGTVTYKGGNDFTFTGTGYSVTDLFDNLKGAMPGDELTEKITFTNSDTSADYVILYMKAQVLEDSDITTDILTLKSGEEFNRDLDVMKDFLHQLNLTVKNGSTVIYDGTPDLVNSTTGLNEFVQIGKFYSGESKDLSVVLEVPEDLGNEYAERVGEVKWIFHVEAFDEDVVTVNKVWSNGNDKHDGETVTINLVKEITDVKTGEVRRMVEDTVHIGASDNWTYTWPNLPQSNGFNGETETYKYSVEEVDIPKGYKASYETTGNVTTITNKKTSSPSTPPMIPSGNVSVSVDKSWELAEGEEIPGSISVTLYRDGDAYDSVTLGESNGWSYTWKDMPNTYSWSVSENDVPEGFTSYVSHSGTSYSITNVSDNLKKPPLSATKTVTKVWDDDNNAMGLRPDSVSVTLLKDGAADQTVTLSAANGWTYTWTELDATASWSVVENENDAYAALYEENGSVTTITNVLVEVPLGGGTMDLTAKKTWSGDKASKRPDAVTLTLYSGSTPVETVTVTKEMNWTYTWNELDVAGNWKVLETSIPKGYCPSYQLQDGVLTVTNTATLIQTGQLNWPIALLGAAGLMLIALGLLVMKRRKAEEQ